MRYLLPLIFAVPAFADADLIVHNAKVVTVDAKSSMAEAVAVQDGKILAVGTSADILKHKGPKTQLIDAGGKMVLPGLMDSHVHPSGAAMSEWKEPMPDLRSLKEIFAFIRKKAETLPEGKWIVLRYAFPTRLDDARFPTKAELDEAAPKHPVLYHAGPAGVCNSMALKVSGVTKDTPNPGSGVVVKDATTGEPTGMLRSAYGVLKGVPGDADDAKPADRRAAIKKLFAFYNEHGLTSVADRNGSKGDLDLFRDMHKTGELSLRINMSRGIGTGGTREQVAKRFDDLPGADKKDGPTGAGDAWVRIGPTKMFLDGGMLNGTAYMRQPWPKGPTYQVTTDDYRGLLFIKQEQLRMVVEEGVKRKWQMTAHTAGEGGMDELLDAYEFVDRITPIKDLRMCITHANFPSQRNLERCKKLGVVADVQPAWLYKDGTTLLNVLGKERVRWFQPFKSWLDYTVIGGGSDHMLRFDEIKSTNPWDPWLGIAVAVHRTTERGTEMFPEEALTREQAIRLYTINNAYITHEEKTKGSLEPGKLADLIVIDRDVLTCPTKDIAGTKVLRTIVGGKTVFERK
ncbi:MAG: amidohydrolase [Gemmataceae bacterium]|nr:amidohydrolase [Gemmataceae bacterium]